MANRIERLREVTSCDQIKSKINEIIDHFERFDELNGRNYNNLYNNLEGKIVELRREIDKLKSEVFKIDNFQGNFNGIIQSEIDDLKLRYEADGELRKDKEPSLTVNDLEIGCWYLIEYVSGNRYVIKFKELTNYQIECEFELRLDDSYSTSIFLRHGENGCRLCSFENIVSIKKLA